MYRMKISIATVAWRWNGIEKQTKTCCCRCSCGQTIEISHNRSDCCHCAWNCADGCHSSPDGAEFRYGPCCSAAHRTRMTTPDPNWSVPSWATAAGWSLGRCRCRRRSGHRWRPESDRPIGVCRLDRCGASATRGARSAATAAPEFPLRCSVSGTGWISPDFLKRRTKLQSVLFIIWLLMFEMSLIFVIFSSNH